LKFIPVGLNRPVADKERIAEMYKHSNLVVTALDNNKLIGISRALTDFCYGLFVFLPYFYAYANLDRFFANFKKNLCF
jgi:hypothetical protein